MIGGAELKGSMPTWLFAMCCPLLLLQRQLVEQMFQDLLGSPRHHHVPVGHGRVSGRILLNGGQRAAAAPFLLSLRPLVVYVAEIGDVKRGHGQRLCWADAVLGALLLILVLLLLHQGSVQQPALLPSQILGLWPRPHPFRVPVPSDWHCCRGYCRLPLYMIYPSI